MGYLAPFLVPFLLMTSFFVYIGESMPLRMVLWHQQSDELVLYRPRYGNRDQQYKELAVNMYQPEVMVLGSSRVLQFRQEFFNLNPDAFYNAAAPAWELDQVQQLLTSVNEDALPDILLLGIDPIWFVEGYVGDVFPPPVSDLDHILRVNSSVLQDWYNDVPFDRQDFENSQYIQRREPRSGSLALGMRAIRDGHGFRNDGSEQFGDFLVAGWLWQPNMRSLHLQWMVEGQQVYPYASDLSQDRLNQMRDVLDYAQQHDILVIGFMPSYAPTLWREMLQTGNHTYVPLVTAQMSVLFAEYDYPFFDYSDGARLGATNEDFFDGWHGSERANLQLYVDLVRQVPELSAYSDADALQTVIDTSSSTWFVFDN